MAIPSQGNISVFFTDKLSRGVKIRYNVYSSDIQTNSVFISVALIPLTCETIDGVSEVSRARAVEEKARGEVAEMKELNDQRGDVLMFFG